MLLDIQAAHIFCNGMASVVLLLVVLQSSWLYIALHASRANRSRSSEVEMLVRSYRGNYLFLQVSFLVGIIFSFLGLGAVVTLKTQSEVQAFATVAMTIVGIVFFFGMLASIIRAVAGLNRKVDAQRKEACSKAIARGREIRRLLDKVQERRSHEHDAQPVPV